MARERQLVQAFVDLADTLVQGFDVMDLLHTLCKRCVEVLDVAAAGVLLVGEAGRLHVVAASSETMRVLELFEAQNSEGPCFEAYTGVEQVLVPELLDAVVRWPSFTAHALADGYRSAYGFPLRLRHECIGALNMFHHTPQAFGDDDRRVGQALADAATIAILHDRAMQAALGLSAQLQGALDSRVAIEQAKGIVATQLGVDMDEAFRRLRRHSMDTNLPLREVATQVVDLTLSPRRLPAPEA